jgi:hypothetical protein
MERPSRTPQTRLTQQEEAIMSIADFVFLGVLVFSTSTAILVLLADY